MKLIYKGSLLNETCSKNRRWRPGRIRQDDVDRTLDAKIE